MRSEADNHRLSGKVSEDELAEGTHVFRISQATLKTRRDRGKNLKQSLCLLSL